MFFQIFLIMSCIVREVASNAYVKWVRAVGIGKLDEWGKM
jgi:hypothetical protein